MRTVLLGCALLLLPLFQDPAKSPALPALGQPAPTIRLNDHHGKAAVVGVKGDAWTVLAFYPKAATPG